jgi:hypothetical protein
MAIAAERDRVLDPVVGRVAVDVVTVLALNVVNLRRTAAVVERRKRQARRHDGRGPAMASPGDHEKRVEGGGNLVAVV